MELLLYGVVILCVGAAIYYKAENATKAFSYVGFGFAALFIAYFGNLYFKTADVEIWNGAVTQKVREHDSYTHTYDCNCKQVCSGSGKDRSCSNQCDTCTEDHYTVAWYLKSTIGNIDIQKLDSTSRSVYNSLDPSIYTVTEVNDPVSKAHTFVNWVKGVDSSLLHPQALDLFKDKIPEYPSRVYRYYSVDRVLWVNMAAPTNNPVWNRALAEMLKTRGNTKQVNAIVVFANINDPMYAEALQTAWLNGKKNDVVVVIGVTPDLDEPKWVRVFSWSDSADFKLQMRDELITTKLEPQAVMDVIAKHIDSGYVRKQMKDFGYLKANIDMPSWLHGLLIVLLIGGIILVMQFETLTNRFYPRNRYRSHYRRW